ncbi:DNA primase [Helicobacter bizzozeronii]|uniref:DNA primase n=1 Tax=Helicobacter bizzozeronii TaxID=56877 RepID=UPI0013155CF3|nr:DNA primase [Helicobacter bizzozeronii]
MLEWDFCRRVLKAVVDIVEVVGGCIELKRAGVEYVAICPFHNEKTPSFYVNPTKNLYKCFGCGVGGDAIDFVKAYERLEFYEAVEKLANRYGVEIGYTHARPKDKESSGELLDQIATCYQGILQSTPHALEYLKKRGISDESIQEFRLGYCDSRQVLAYIEKYRLDKKALHKLGVLALGGAQGNTQYATLFNRIIFPIQSMNGAVVAFGGRALEQEGVKYINSSASVLFNKSKTLYGYFQARPHILEEQRIIITEGYIDVVLAHQAGIKTAVATLGTSLTPDHLPLLRPLKERSPIIMAYDMDNAGQEATMRAIELLSVNLKYGGVVELESGLDVADMVAQGKITQLKEALSKPVPFIQYSLKRALLGYDLDNPLDFMHASRECFKTLDRLIADPNGIKAYEAWLQKEYGFTRVEQVQQPTDDMFVEPNSTLVEDMLLCTLLLHPECIEQISPYFDSKYFIFERNAQTYDDILAGKRNTPHQVELLNLEATPRLIARLEQAGELLENVRGCALELGRRYWSRHWRGEAQALIGKNQTTRVFNMATHADLIERFCTLENLRYMHILPDLKRLNPYQQFPESLWGISYDPRKMILAVDEHFARFGDQAYYHKGF